MNQVEPNGWRYDTVSDLEPIIVALSNISNSLSEIVAILKKSGDINANDEKKSKL